MRVTFSSSQSPASHLLQKKLIISFCIIFSRSAFLSRSLRWKIVCLHLLTFFLLTLQDAKLYQIKNRWSCRAWSRISDIFPGGFFFAGGLTSQTRSPPSKNDIFLKTFWFVGCCQIYCSPRGSSVEDFLSVHHLLKLCPLNEIPVFPALIRLCLNICVGGARAACPAYWSLRTSRNEKLPDMLK